MPFECYFTRRRTWLGKSVALFALLGALLVGAVALAQASPLEQSPEEGQAIFEQKCAACHTIGSGKLVGPDLQGVTERREKDWLAHWIKEPDKMLAEGDPTAVQLLQEYNDVPMPNLGLTDEQVAATIAYLESLEAGTTALQPAAIPSLYFPVLVAAIVTLGGLTAVGLLAARKRVEVRL